MGGESGGTARADEGKFVCALALEKNMTKKPFLVVLSALVIGGCSSSSPASSETDDGGGPAGKDICPLIDKADVQALVVPAITSVTNVDGVVCQFADSGEGIKVERYDNDASKSSYNNLHGNDAGSTDHSIQGVGDEAYWNEAIDGKAPPELIAHKGNVTCVIQSPDPPDTTCKTTDDGSGIPAFSNSDALAYVQLMAKVCNDVFSVDK
jgi:hypothetical protein